MRGSLVLTTVLIGIAAGLTMSTPATAALPRCPIRASATPRADVSAVAGLRTVFYEVTFSYAGAHYGQSYACDRWTRRRRRLTDDLFGRDTVGRPISRRSVAIAGPFGAWSWGAAEGGNQFFTGLDIIDVRTGVQRVVDVVGSDAGPLGPYHYIRLALRASGALAWTTTDGVFTCRDCFAGTKALVQRLATGAGLDPRSLAKTRRGVTWRQAGVARHARLR